MLQFNGAAFQDRFVNTFDWDLLIPSGTGIRQTAKVSSRSDGGGIAGIIGMIIGGLIGAAFAIGLDILYVFAFTWIVVAHFDISLEAIKEVLPAAMVGFAIILSFGIIIGAFMQSVRAGLFFLVLRVISLYVAYLTALAGIFFYEKYIADAAVEFAANPILPEFIKFGQLDLTEAIGGAVVAKLIGLVGARSSQSAS